MTEMRTILIVEDEPLIAMMLEDYLDMLGKGSAGTAESVAAAMARIDDGGLDAAILDIHLRNGETSWPVADRLAEAGIPFVLATGGSGDTIVEAHRDRPVLVKPFSLDGIESALAKLS